MTGPGESSARSRRLWALMVKESRQILRDPSSLLIAFALPVLLLFLFGYGVSLDATRTRIGLVVEQPTPNAVELADGFRGSTYFQVVTTVRDRREVAPLLDRGRLRGIVVIPADFEAQLHRRSRPAEVQVIVDGSDPNTASLVQGYAQGVVATWSRIHAGQQGRTATSGVVRDRVWFNPELSSRFFLVPGSVAIVMALVGTLLTALVIAREWERGTMEALMATPVSSAELLLGKIVPYFVLALLSMSLCALIAVLIFGVPFRGSVPALLLVSGAFLLPALGQGLLISAATKNQFLASQISLLTAFLPTFLLSGFLFEIASMPRWIQWICVIVPARYLIPSLQTVFLAGDLWPFLLRNVAILVLLGAVLLGLSVRTTRKRVA